MAVSDFAQELVRVVRGQLAEFGGLDESHPKLRKQIKRYWEETGHRFPDRPKRPGEETPWSAVFVSWCLMEAGATKEEFKFAPAHAIYVKKAIENADKGVGVFRAMPIEKARVEVGDLIHANRENGRITYDQARTRDKYPSHCDIVVAVGSGFAEVIGGNLRNTRAMDTVELTAGGFVKQKSRNPYISVVKNLKGRITAEEDEVMATVIKIDDPNDHQLWLYAGGQRRPLKSVPEINELRQKGLLDNGEIRLSPAVFNEIPIMPGAAQ